MQQSACTETMDKQLKRSGIPTGGQGTSSSGSVGGRSNSGPVNAVKKAPNQPQWSNNTAGTRRDPHFQGPKGSGNHIAPRGISRPQGVNSNRELGLTGAEFGSRKHNFNHLINNYNNARQEPYGAGLGGFYNRYEYLQQQPVNSKEQFLQANCQFIVKEDGDYAVHHVDPDVLVDWDNVELVKVWSHESPSCPICLHPPIAAKMTRCGHIYCWPCLLHYLSLAEEDWRRCPICFEPVRRKDLKSAVVETVPLIKAGSEITMKLMACEKGSTDVIPADGWVDRGGLFENFEDTSHREFAKVLLIRPDQLHKAVLEREERELLFALETEKDHMDMHFVELALKDLADRFADPSCQSPASMQTSASPDSLFATAEDDGREAVIRSRMIRPETENINYFYQAADGQHIYLHPLNYRMLVAEYGSLRFAPAQITAKVLDIEQHSICEQSRKRYRYLGHLPLTCVFNIMEIELKPPSVSEEVMHTFEKEVSQRERNRQTKHRKETSKQQEAENAFRKDIRGRMVYSYQSEHFPSMTEARTAAELNLKSEEAFPAVGSRPSASSTSSASVASPSSSNESKSFATMIREAVHKPSATAWSSQRPVKAPAAVPAAVASTSRRADPDSQDEEDEQVQRVPDFQASFSAGFSAMLDKLDSEDYKPNEKQGRGGSKKKGKKSMVVLSSGMAPRV